MAGLGTEATVGALTANSRSSAKECGHGNFLLSAHRPLPAHVLAIALLGQLHSLSYSRDVESRADLTGSDICAAAGYNPWGLVWLFRDFDKADVGQVPQLLSDHPSNQNRVDALEQHFRNNPSVFGKFNPDSTSATRFVALEKAPEVFLR